jgi:hypothetical protein
MKFILDRIASWITLEPFISLLMIIAAVAIFLRSYKQIQEDANNKFWYWFKKIVEAIGITVLFLGLLWVSRAVLNDNYKTFIANHGRVSKTNYESVQNIWGGPHIQRELSVHHTIDKEFITEIPREDISAPPLYKKEIKTVDIEQNSILKFKGTAELHPNKRQKGSAFYNGFETNLTLDYDIINDSEFKTDAFFFLPLSKNQALYDNFVINVNGKDISEKLRFSGKDVNWTMQMNPAEVWKVNIRYQTRGLDYFYYQIPYSRQIKDFNFKLVIYDLPVAEINYPGGCIPPTKEILPTEDKKGSILEWQFNNTITTAGMGIALPAPEQPGERTTLVLASSPYALMMLILAICLTFLLMDKRINLVEIALLSGVYCLIFIVMASLADSFLGFWGSFIAGSILTVALSFILFRAYNLLLKICLLSLVGFFTFVYPLLNQFPDFKNSLNGLVMALLIVYLFVVAFSTKLKAVKKA